MIKRIIQIAILVALFCSIVIPVVDSHTDGDSTLQVYVLAGQSNAAYSEKSARCNVEYVREHVEAPSVKLWYYGTESMPIRNGISSSTPSIYDPTFASYSLWEMYRDGAWQIGGEEATLGKTIGDRTNTDVLIINTGVENQSVAQLAPSSTQGTYVANVLSHALNLIDRSEYKHVEYMGVVWIQGESDNVNHTTQEAYISGFNTVKNWYAGKGFEQWYIVQIRPLNGDTATQAQLKIAESEPNVKLTTIAQTFTVANGLMNSDDVHYTQEARCLIGEVVGDMTPSEYHSRGETSALISVVPFVILVGLVLGTVTMFIARRD